MKNKKGILGEGILMIYRLLIVSLIAFIVLGVSSIFYAHYIDVRDAEARILAKVVVDCISPAGVLDLSDFPKEDRLSILSYCGFEDFEVERFYVGVEIWDVQSDGKKIAEFSQGDSGARWVQSIKGKISDDLRKYEPGYFEFGYPVWVLRDGERFFGGVKMEVLVNSE